MNRDDKRIRDSILSAGVANLKEFGYPSVNKSNILKDYLFSKMFLSMLESDENKTKNPNIEKVRLELIAELTPPTTEKFHG